MTNTFVQFPNKPVGYPENAPTLGREIYGNDLQTLGENINNVFGNVYGNTDFAIVSGVVGPGYGGTLGNYSPGIVILFGVPYYFPGGILFNKWLVPDSDGVQLQNVQAYNDATTHPTYRVYTVKINNSSVAGSSPQFMDSMEQYKVDLNKLRLKALQVTSLKDVTQTISTSTTINGDFLDSSLVNGHITISGTGHTIIYNYNIAENVNFVCFDISCPFSMNTFTFNIKDVSGTLLSLSNPQSVKVLLFRGSSGWVVYDLRLDPDTINSDITTLNNNISTINGEISVINSNISTIQSQNPNNIISKIINIGNWNMHGAGNYSKIVAHGVSDFTKIVGIDVVIRDDSDSIYKPINTFYNTDSTSTQGGAVEYFDNTNIKLNRMASGVFDSTSYSTTPYNRGFIVIRYYN